MEYQYYKRRSRREHDGTPRFTAWTAADAIALLLTTAIAAMLLCGYLAPVVSPLKAWPIAFAGLIIPVLYLLNLFMLCYWVVRWRLYLFIPLLCVVLGIGVFPSFFRLDMGRRYDTEIKERSAFRLISFNVECFKELDSTGRPWGYERTAEYLLSENPDILCMQEFLSDSPAEKDRFDEMMDERLPNSRVHFTTANSDEKTGIGLAIYSRYPIVASGNTSLGGNQCALLWADLKVRRDTLRVLTTHMQSTSITATDKKYIDNQEFLSDQSSGEKFRDIVRKLREGFRVRATQADSVAAVIAESPYPVVVCGDFNDTPVSYATRRVRGTLEDTFRSGRSGLGSTYRGFYNMLRIDYIFHSEQLETLSHDTPDVAYSDHRPVVATLRIVNN